MCLVRSNPSLLYLSTHDESIPEFDKTNSALDESKRSDVWWVGLATRRDELGGDKSDHDKTIWVVDATNSLATRRIGPIHDEMIWEVNETNSVHSETNRNNDWTTRNANLVLDLTSYVMTTATRKLTAEEGKPNNRNNGWKYEHETMKCYVTENNWRNKYE